MGKAVLRSTLDLFAGCGGLSLGAHQAGFRTALAIDSDTTLTSSFKLNFPKAALLSADVRSLDATAIKLALPSGVAAIDGVLGGPPCQAFSEMGRRNPNDPRRTLVKDFFRIVKAVRPKFFLFENVRGLGFEENIQILEEGLNLLPSTWKIYGPKVLNAADFGAPTRRLRLFVVGFNRDEASLPSQESLFDAPNESTTVEDAISDLESASDIGADSRGFDSWKYDKRRSISSYAASVRTKSGTFTGHSKTVHTRSTLKRFSDLSPGSNDKIGKYHRLTWDGLCPTLRAGTGSDRGSYQAVRPVHPSIDRVITPREAARLQGFPDNFLFHPTVWHSCRMIGNSVSPIIAKSLLKRIANCLPPAER